MQVVFNCLKNWYDLPFLEFEIVLTIFKNQSAFPFFLRLSSIIQFINIRSGCKMSLRGYLQYEDHWNNIFLIKIFVIMSPQEGSENVGDKNRVTYSLRNVGTIFPSSKDSSSCFHKRGIVLSSKCPSLSRSETGENFQYVQKRWEILTLSRTSFIGPHIGCFIGLGDRIDLIRFSSCQAS